MSTLYAPSFKQQSLSVYLAYVEGVLKEDRLFNPHYRFYVREMRVLAYAQLLESYQSLTLNYMADAFGVTVSFMDRYSFYFVCKLSC